MKLPRFCQEFVTSFPNGNLFVVGGAVRDDLLSRPITDIDFVVAGVARADLEAWLESRGRVDLTGSRFGVYKFVPAGFSGKDTVYDIALPRTEQASATSLGGYRDFDIQSDASLPIESDLARRDFTINAMAFNVRTGERVDPWNGESDLRARVIRTVGIPEERFVEDFSRLLRAIRFAVQLQFEIEPLTWAALVEQLPDLNRRRPAENGGEEYVVPRETVGKEVAKMLLADPVRAVDLLTQAGAIPLLFPPLTHLETAHLSSSSPLPVTLALLFRGQSPSDVRRLMRESGLTSLPSASPLRADADDVAWLVERAGESPDIPEQMRGSEFERLYMNERGTWYIDLLRAIGKRDIADRAAIRAQAIRKTWNADPEEKIPSLVSGTDALQAGIPAGPQIRDALDLVRDAQLDGSISTSEEAKELLRKQVR